MSSVPISVSCPLTLSILVCLLRDDLFCSVDSEEFVLNGTCRPVDGCDGERMAHHVSRGRLPPDGENSSAESSTGKTQSKFKRPVHRKSFPRGQSQQRSQLMQLMRISLKWSLIHCAFRFFACDVDEAAIKMTCVCFLQNFMNGVSTNPFVLCLFLLRFWKAF